MSEVSHLEMPQTDKVIASHSKSSVMVPSDRPCIRFSISLPT